jgi:hypothetical protein
VLGLEPGQRLPVAGQLFRCDAGTGPAEAQWISGRGEQAVSGIGGVQVVIEHPADGAVAVGLILFCCRALGCVDAEQVVEGEPARDALGQQVHPGQLAEQQA